MKKLQNILACIIVFLLIGIGCATIQSVIPGVGVKAHQELIIECATCHIDQVFINLANITLDDYVGIAAHAKQAVKCIGCHVGNSDPVPPDTQ